MDFDKKTILDQRYRILRRISHPGSDELYLACDEKLDHAVVLKIHPEPASGMSDGFLRVAKDLQILHHPNLQRITDGFVIRGHQVLVLEYIPGDNLQDLLLSDGPFRFDTVLCWISPIFSAISYLHRHQPAFHHGDVQPANIILTTDGEIVLVNVNPSVYSTLNDQAGDQFWLASTIYSLLSGQPPQKMNQYSQNNSSHLLSLVANENIPHHAMTALERALSINPCDRFSNVDEFLLHLKDDLPNVDKKEISSPQIVNRDLNKIPDSNTSVQWSGGKRNSPILSGLIIGLSVIVLLAVLFFLYIRFR
jgi:serine/threonine protein kinase